MFLYKYNANETTSRKSVWALTNRSTWNIEHWKYSAVANSIGEHDLLREEGDYLII